MSRLGASRPLPARTSDQPDLFLSSLYAEPSAGIPPSPLRLLGQRGFKGAVRGGPVHSGGGNPTRFAHVESKRAVIGFRAGLTRPGLLSTLRAFDCCASATRNLRVPCPASAPPTDQEQRAAPGESAAFPSRVGHFKLRHFPFVRHRASLDGMTSPMKSQARERTQVLRMSPTTGGRWLSHGGTVGAALAGQPTTATIFHYAPTLHPQNPSANSPLYRRPKRGDFADVLYDILDTPVSPSFFSGNAYFQKTEDIVARTSCTTFPLLYAPFLFPSGKDLPSGAAAFFGAILPK